MLRVSDPKGLRAKRLLPQFNLTEVLVVIVCGTYAGPENCCDVEVLGPFGGRRRKSLDLSVVSVLALALSQEKSFGAPTSQIRTQ